jgi:hypothetical protein
MLAPSNPSRVLSAVIKNSFSDRHVNFLQWQSTNSERLPNDF